MDSAKHVYVLITAHPDDESMFFLPFLEGMRQRDDIEVWLLCLTTGNYNGLGEIRVRELHQCCANVLKLNLVLPIIDDQKFQDHPTKRWSIEHVANYIHVALEKLLNKVGCGSITQMTLVTFDEGGISGHVNHRDTYYAVQHFYLQQLANDSPSPQQSSSMIKFPKMQVWTLDTIRFPLRKYVPLLEWIFALFCLVGLFPRCASDLDGQEGDKTSCTTITFRLHDPLLNWRAMAAHHSQFVWYRRLFVIFSCYTYMNRFTPLKQKH